jgi:hypothetical protein
MQQQQFKSSFAAVFHCFLDLLSFPLVPSSTLATRERRIGETYYLVG